MSKFYLTNKANDDLDEIWEYTFDEWSEMQADKYYFEILNCCQLIAENQNLGKIYSEIDNNLFGYLINKHIIFYQTISKFEILVVRILHTKMDLKSRIKELKKNALKNLRAALLTKKCYVVFTYFLSSIAACAAANLAIGTRNGEQLT
mgnify:FL=1